MVLTQHSGVMNSAKTDAVVFVEDNNYIYRRQKRLLWLLFACSRALYLHANISSETDNDCDLK